MTRIDIPTARARAALPVAGAAALISALALTACGSSSSGSTTTSSSANAANRRTQIADCLRKQGVTPPARRFGAGAPGGGAGAPAGPRPGGGLFFGGGPGGPGGRSGANASKFRAAARKCGLRVGAGRRRGFFSSPAAKQALAKFAACVRRNGYNLPAPNTSGNGPVFDPTKVNRSDPKLQAAARKCQSLIPRFGPRPGGPQAGPPPAQ